MAPSVLQKCFKTARMERKANLNKITAVFLALALVTVFLISGLELQVFILMALFILVILFQAGSKWLKKHREEEEKRSVVFKARRLLQKVEVNRIILGNSKNMKELLRRFDEIALDIEKLKKLEDQNPGLSGLKIETLKKTCLREKERAIRKLASQTDRKISEEAGKGE